VCNSVPLSSGYSIEIEMRIGLGFDDEEAEQQYERVRFALQRHEDEIDPPAVVRLTRRAPRAMPAADLAAALSVCRDAMVDVLGVPGDHPDVEWVFEQAPGPEALLIEVTPRR